MFVLLLCPRCTSRDEFAGGKFVGFCNILQLHVAAFCWSLRPCAEAAGGPTSVSLSSLEECPWLQHKRPQCSRDLPAEVKAQPLEHRGVWQGPHALLLTATKQLTKLFGIPFLRCRLPHEWRVTALKAYGICIYSNASTAIDLRIMCCTGTNIFLGFFDFHLMLHREYFLLCFN